MVFVVVASPVFFSSRRTASPGHRGGGERAADVVSVIVADAGGGAIRGSRGVSPEYRREGPCRDFVKAGAYKGLTPADVVAASDITFCCVSNSHAAKEMVFGNCGVLQEIKDNKGYVEMTSIDPDTSQDISEAIMLRGGRYLEAPVSGSKKPAEDGTLIILAAGDRSLFNDCATCFEAIGRHAFYLGKGMFQQSFA
ncbi:hypothetical protein HPB49_024277 [Dermacentor silvarum]|uniref:Uncharacterized protein n=1 Tax=Dermacentor silvarum TaxID=543639 RepID=A0ACB8D0S0_DERSI|nr:hypothetical protein HPB49_024277 [Dermacentor silvarum]